MKFLKHSVTNAVFVTFMSALYSFLFIYTSKHVEVTGVFTRYEASNYDFINDFSSFIARGYIKYIGYLIIGFTIILLLLIAFKREKKYDEYQVSILSKSLIVAGVLSMIMMPLIVMLFMNEPSHCVETIFLFVIVQWFSVLIADFVYVIRY